MASVLVEQIVAAHSRLPRQACRDHDDVGILRVHIVVGADDLAIAADDRRGFHHVQSLALWHALDNIDQRHISEAPVGDAVGASCANVASSNDGDLLQRHRLVLHVVDDCSSEVGTTQ
jgi:hypothetical protein